MNEIILVRHGKAEDHGLRVTDYERQLTPPGQKKGTVCGARSGQ